MVDIDVYAVPAPSQQKRFGLNIPLIKGAERRDYTDASIPRPPLEHLR